MECVTGPNMKLQRHVKEKYVRQKWILYELILKKEKIPTAELNKKLKDGWFKKINRI